MTRLDPPSLPRLHEDAERFEEAVRFTASETRFLPRLIEKDYFCTLLLGYLSTADSSLVFKGGGLVWQKFTSDSIASARIWISSSRYRTPLPGPNAAGWRKD